MRKATVRTLIALALLVSISPAVMAANLGDRTLRQGLRGDDVAQLQQRLNDLNFQCGKADGIFGFQTEDAVCRFQGARGLLVDGIVGPKTLAAMRTQSPSRSATGRFSQRDVELLARLVYAEARGESYEGQVAVAATVINRVNSPSYPASIPQVIYEVVNGHYQFSPVLDGQINMNPDDTARRAALDALSGYDPSGGATIFFNPSKTGDQWVRSKSFSVTIGNHVFAK